MAETMLADGPAARDGGDRYQAVVLVDASVLAGGEGRCHLDDGPALSADTALRLACDAAVVAMSLGEGGEPLTVGRSTKAIPRVPVPCTSASGFRTWTCTEALAPPGPARPRRGLPLPGLHAAPLRRRPPHRALVQGRGDVAGQPGLLCRAHHRAVHEGGYGLRRRASGGLVFTTPDGAVLHQAPQTAPVELDVEALNRHLGLVITSSTGACLWGGERLDLGLAIDGILGLEEAG